MKQRIIIADTDRAFREELVRALGECAEFEVVGIADDGEQAIQMLHEHQPDILILDFLLPQYDGIAVLQELRYMPKRPQVLAATLFINNYVAKSAARLGVKQLLRKPCGPRIVVERLQQMLRATNAAASRGND